MNFQEGNLRNDFSWIEDSFSPEPIGNMCVAGEDLKYLYPIPRIDFFGFGTGLEWKHYHMRRRTCLPEIVEPLASFGCHTREESEQYEAARAIFLKELRPELRHRFLVAFIVSSGNVSCSFFETAQKFAANGEFRFANLWKIVDPMQIAGYAEHRIQQEKERQAQLKKNDP